MIIEKYFGISRETVQQLIAATKNMEYEKSGDNRFQNTKAYLFDEFAVLKMQNINFRNVTTEDMELKHLERLAVTILDLQSKGINVVPILAFQSDNGDGFIIQPRAKGAELYDRVKASDKNYVLKRVELLSNVPQEHFDKFVSDIIAITDTGVLIDFVGKDNFFYHEKIGFQFIDLNTHYDYVYGLDEIKPQSEQVAVYGCFLPCWFDTVPEYRNSVSKLLPELTDRELSLLQEHNRSIFEKCKTAMLNNGIAKEMIDNIIMNAKFIPQIKLLISEC
jgi:hypothetical protein